MRDFSIFNIACRSPKLFAVLLVLVALPGLCQVKHLPPKPAIDSAAVMNWAKINTNDGDDVIISNDGHFFSYLYYQKGYSGTSQRILQSMADTALRSSFGAAKQAFFSADSRFFYCLSGGALIRRDLRLGTERRTEGIERIYQPYNKSDLYVYQEKNKQRAVFIMDSKMDRALYRIEDATDFSFDPTGKRLLVEYVQHGAHRFKWIDLQSGRSLDLALSENNYILEKFSFDRTGDRIVFAGSAASGAVSVWLYDVKKGIFTLKADSALAKLSKDERISLIAPGFTGDGRYIFFKVEKKDRAAKVAPNTSSLDIWNYRDAYLQSQQLLDKVKKLYTFSVGVESEKVLRLEDDEYQLAQWAGNRYDVLGDVAIINRSYGELSWKLDSLNWLVSLRDGSRRPLIISNRTDFSYSPTGKYIIYTRFKDKRWDLYSYSTSSGITVNMTGSIPKERLLDHYSNGKIKYEDGKFGVVSLAAWLAGEEELLVYDSNDIYRLSLSGKHPAEEVTNGYGRKNRTRLKLIYPVRKNEFIDPKAELLLTAFNWKTKFNGFYRVKLGSKCRLDSLAMGPWSICLLGDDLLPLNDHISNKGMAPLKAQDANLWLVKRNSINDAPNYFATSDFRTYRRLTDIQPQRKYNWYGTELARWSGVDGSEYEGLLYKPENFDPTQKYPVVIYQYRELSQRLYTYLQPDLIKGAIDIPWLVSNGYLVLTPDVYPNSKGQGAGAYSSVASAVDWLKMQAYVDPNRLGLNGHSRGAFQTNYIIAHTNVFAAVLSGAGGADEIASAFGLGYMERSRMQVAEQNSGFLWTNQDNYIANSPILEADKISSPLLLFHCKSDRAVPWELSRQLFIAMRRLEKPAWLLQYDNGNHELLLNRDKADYTKRVMQFFDHYLKGAPAPLWMTKGVSARLKGIETGLEIDTVGSKTLPSNPYLKN